MPVFYLSDHQHKGRAYADALTREGWTRTEDVSAPELHLALFDHDVAEGGRGYRAPLDYLHERGARVVMYPHAARPMVQWDGMYPIWPHTRLCAVIAEGQREVMRAYGYPLPVEVCGWGMCEIIPPTPPRPSPFSPKTGREMERSLKVLFAPIHPNHNGWLHPVDKAANATTYQKLLEMSQMVKMRLIVRHVLRLDLSGLWPAAGVEYVIANPNGSTKEIDQADVVVAHQTFAYLAAARGKPLIMFGDDITPHSGNSWDVLRWANRYEAYREIMRYPAEAESCRGARELLELVELVMGEDIGRKWRAKFIGEPLDGKNFSDLMESLL